MRALPDCRDVADPFYLTVDQRRELILLIADLGEAGIDEFVRRHEKDDSAIARKIQKLRAQLLEEASELRRRLHTDFDEKRAAERGRVERVLERLRHEEEDLAAQERRLVDRLPDEIERRIRSLPILEIALRPPRLSAWQRLWNAVRRFLGALWRLLLRPFRTAAKSWRPRAIAVGVPGLHGPGVQVDLDLERALASNPNLRKRVRQRLGDSWAVRTRRLWRIMLGLDNYAEVAHEIMEEDARRAAQERSSELEGERQRLEEELRRRREEETRAAQETATELSRLDDAERTERARLDEMLAAKPERTVGDLVVGELEAGGFVERVGDRLNVTGRYLESLAALVYAEEAKGIGPTTESPLGTSIEGEGLLERSPLLSYYETSHMDTVTSLVQARQRHPHVRHLLEEDILVYRERRHSQTHLVIILDKSLSMEENDRMEAAKRAALALYWGVKKKSALNQIDFLLMDTSVHRASLQQCWEAKPRGFTNTGRALELARALLVHSRATRRLLFLVTDGLPEALTFEGRDVAGRPEEALSYAVRQAERLRDVKNLGFTLVLLEPKDALFVKAAERLASKGRGKVVKVTPQELTRSLLVEFREQALEARALVA